MAVRIALRARIRKRLRAALGRLLGMLFTANLSNEPIPQKQLRRILIVRTNHRIGNLLFLTPLLRALHDLLANCQIDLVIGLQAARSLLQPLPGIDRVYVLPKPALSTLPGMLQLLRRLRGNRYDLSIDPNGKSASGRLALALVSSRWRLGFRVEGSWSPITHGVTLPQQTLHEAQRPLLLLQALQGGKQAKQMIATATLHLALRDEEKCKGAQTLQSLLAVKPTQDNETLVLGLFRHARRDKRIADEWWLSWIQEFHKIAPQVCMLEVLSPDVTKPLLGDAATLQIADLRLLAAVLSQLDIFVCADTGPMHLASAAGVPTIALFNATTPALYGPVGADDLVLQQNQLSAKELAEAVYKHLRKLRPLHFGTVTVPAEGMGP